MSHKTLLAIGRRVNRQSSEQIHIHEEVLSNEEAASAAEDEEDDPYVSGDDYDEDYVPIVDGEISDVDNELEVEEELPEHYDGDIARCDEVAEQELNVSIPVRGVRRLLGEKEHYDECKIGNMFLKQEPSAASTTKPVGPAQRFLPNPVAIFRDIMSPQIVDIIVQETNRKAGEVMQAWNKANLTCKQKEWQPTDDTEMYAWFGLLLFSGVFHCNNMQAKDLWHSRHFDIYNATMSLDRFKLLLRFVRFDGVKTRSARMVLSKSAPIDDIWTKMNHNLQEAYTPNTTITIDVQLFPYRGRTTFTQCIPSKLAKYGIKIWWVCDSSTKYPLKGQIYTGKRSNDKREINQGERVALDLVEKYRNSGRTVYCDNIITTDNKTRLNTMDKILPRYSCKRATNRWPLAIFYNMLDVIGLASYIIYKHLRPSMKSDQRRDFILELAEQLTIPHMERRAANLKVYGRPAIKLAMQKFNVFYDPPSTSMVATSRTASKSVSSQYRPLCKLCTKLDKFKRKTRFTCHICKDAMCLIHGAETRIHTCNVCLAAAPSTT